MPTLDQPSRITEGRPVKALSPNCRGGPFTGRRQTAATSHLPPSGSAADIRTEPAVHTPEGAGYVPRFGPGYVQVSISAHGPALADRSFRELRRRQERTRHTANRRRPPVPTSTPRRHCRVSTYSTQRSRLNPGRFAPGRAPVFIIGRCGRPFLYKTELYGKKRLRHSPLFCSLYFLPFCLCSCTLNSRKSQYCVN